VTAPAQLTLAALTAAQAQVPTATWMALTAKQQAFVAALAANPTMAYIDAARLAGSPRAKQTGSQWANDPKVKAALDAIRAAAQTKAESAFQFVDRRLKENDSDAKHTGDLSASNGALSLYATVHGLLEKRVRLSVDNPSAAIEQLRRMPRDERVKLLAEMFAQ
jgi:hypothetical protein